MKKSRITIKGNYRSDDTVSFEVIKTVFTGEGSLDFENTTIDKGVTEQQFPNDDDAIEYFENKYSSDEFDFDFDFMVD